MPTLKQALLAFREQANLRIYAPINVASSETRWRGRLTPHTEVVLRDALEWGRMEGHEYIIGTRAIAFNMDKQGLLDLDEWLDREIDGLNWYRQ